MVDSTEAELKPHRGSLGKLTGCAHTFVMTLQAVFTFSAHFMGKISLTSPIVIDVPTRASLAIKTKGLLFP